MKVVDEVRRDTHFDSNYIRLWEKFVATMPKENESAEDYIAANPEKFFIPFEDNFKCLQQKLIEGQTRVRPVINAIACLQAPAVTNTDSVRRRDNRKPQPSRIDAETGADATIKWRLVVLLLANE
jgi:hypothetical protein